MKKTILFVGLLALGATLSAAPARAQGTDATGDYHGGTLTLGGSFTDFEDDSSKFLEYRDVPDGVTNPGLKVFGRSGDLTYTAFGYTMGKDDLRYGLKTDYKELRFTGDFQRLPHRFGYQGLSLYRETSPGVFSLQGGVSEAAQSRILSVPRSSVNYTFLNGIVEGNRSGFATTEIGLTRQRGNLALDVFRDRDYKVKLTYFREDRDGSRQMSQAFGFGNVVENYDPVDYTTQDVAATASLDRSWGGLRGAIRYNWFANAVPYARFQNLFRSTDASDGSAYQAPGSASVAGAAWGALSLPADNAAVTASVGGTYKFGKKTRATADFSYGKWTQNDTAFLPYTTNTSILTPSGQRATDASILPASHLDGKADIISFSASLTSRPVRKLTLNARLRSYDLDNKTPRLEFPGYVRFDGVWEDIGRISVPYGYRNDRFEASAGYDLSPVRLEAGYRYGGFHRTFRETEKTNDHTGFANVSWNVKDGIMLRGTYEKSQRGFHTYHALESEEASFEEGGPAANLFALDESLGGPPPGRYDQAERDRDRITALLQLAPTDKVSLSLSYFYTKDLYNPDVANRATLYGLTENEYDTFSADVDFTPNEKLTLFGFYSYESNKDAQRGRQSGGTVSVNPIDDWTSDVADKVNTFGGGADVRFLDKWAVNLNARYQEVDGRNDITAVVGGAAYNPKVALGGPAGFEAYDDSRLWSVGGEVKYAFQKAWSASVGAWHEFYKFSDDGQVPRELNGQVFVYAPAALYINALDGSYTSTVGYVRLSYTW